MRAVLAYTAATLTGVAAWSYYKRRTSSPPVGVRVTYWGGRGLCEPLRCILAAAGVEWEDVFLTAETGPEELSKLRAAGKLEFDQLPMVEIDGLNLVQTRATANYLGARFGLLPKASPADAYLVECIYGSTQDARMPMVGLPFASYPAAPTPADFASKLEELKGPRGLVGRYATKWEKLLKKGGGPFFLGATPSIADVGVFEACDCFSTLFGDATYEEVFAPFPLVRSLVTATRSLGRLAEYCDVDRKAHDTWDPATGKHTNFVKYATSVRKTLG